MQLFTCSSCSEVVYFENSQCVHCGHMLAYVAVRGAFTALEPVAGAPVGTFLAVSPALQGAQVRMCGNHIDHDACNWALMESDSHRFCEACRLNDIIPNLSDPDDKSAWIKLEGAKRRLVYQLLALGLPVEPKSEQQDGLAFAFKKDQPGQEKVMIEQDSGLITLNIAEADSPFREKMRLSLGESYRTLLGHFRHESGHYYFERSVLRSPLITAFRDLFGDERASYGDALSRHYKDGAPADWPMNFVSSYATMHPHEDWAECWAHYLHMVDTLQTARSLGVTVRSKAGRGDQKVEVATQRLNFEDFDELRQAWPPLTVALNCLNRSMGLADLYPFVLPEAVLHKLRFVHEVVQTCGVATRAAP